MQEDMNTLFEFLENFETENIIRIYDESEFLLFNGKIGDVPLKISSKAKVIRKSAVNCGEYLMVTVSKEKN